MQHLWPDRRVGDEVFPGAFPSSFGRWHSGCLWSLVHMGRWVRCGRCRILAMRACVATCAVCRKCCSARERNGRTDGLYDTILQCGVLDCSLPALFAFQARLSVLVLTLHTLLPYLSLHSTHSVASRSVPSQNTPSIIGLSSLVNCRGLSDRRFLCNGGTCVNAFRV